MIYFFLPVGIQGLEFDVFFPTSEGSGLGVEGQWHKFGVEGQKARVWG